jgi:hypothetical protein
VRERVGAKLEMLDLPVKTVASIAAVHGWAEGKQAHVPVLVVNGAEGEAFYQKRAPTVRPP